MNRVINIANKMDWQLIPYPVDFKYSKKFSWKPNINFLSNISTFQSATHEWIGMISYFLLGRSSKIY